MENLPEIHSPVSWTMVNQGAEARIWRILGQGDGTQSWISTSSSSTDSATTLRSLLQTQRSIIGKERFKKTYRLEVLDKKITKSRVNAETKCILKCKKLEIDVPDLYFVDTKNAIIFMEDLLPPHPSSSSSSSPSPNRNPMTVRDFFVSKGIDSNPAVLVAKSMGVAIGKMHASANPNPNPLPQTTLIDFGLSSLASNNKSGEDKAVDLYVLERAMISTHTGSESLMQHILDSYKEQFEVAVWKKISARLESVRQRGRKRECFG
ncbi:hypothetical protein ScalyP_jg2564 [Parmales sp. scaly parma]|nr:hypothetical protein ScalyP_jg2564 [Parmales sp. scaly parma]